MLPKQRVVGSNPDIRTWTNPGDLVLDPMAGSGTALKAAVELGRIAVGIEIEEGYCRLIREHMATLKEESYDLPASFVEDA